MRRPVNLLLAAALLALCNRAPAQTPIKPLVPQQNASYLSRRYLTDTKNAAALTNDFIPKADRLFQVRFLFPNGGLLGATGALDHAPYAAKTFLGQVSAYEGRARMHFNLMPYLNGYSLQDTAHPANLPLDLRNPRVRARIVTECARYVSSRVPGSYVAGAPRVFDGVILDIEPAGDPAFFASFKTLVAEIRASFDTMGLKNKTIGVATPQETEKSPKPNWGWDASDYYYMARYVNYVVAMTYDSGATDASLYKSWIGDQTTRILKGVSGARWNFDSNHPQPTNDVKVLIGLPGFHTATKAHDPAIENAGTGALGIKQAISLLNATDRVSLRYMEGATMYNHDDGTPATIFARYDQDWSWWQQYWLRP